ncbi:NAD-dependent epimerase/dehydratase family protein [Flagellimonas nanhaiensis]|uniref:NAD-dependent epimerase/dehydratase family protein n=1 Tax=Flagellimonas nanhaiensis TaxID=2292706 RepID=A0A371JVU1_9FLAO|nr:NAD-dependent epimerase/dehydratase family protein [Allomuricauda nanhaiensis]RDY61934.1 NAD-dependent epimerase/dehydratase family protein [Allomuricauda nanhaiensis]
MDKRTFLKSAVVSTTALLALGPIACAGNKEKKKALILGGRGFLGPTIVTKFLEAGYEVTLLNRGKTNPHLFTELPIIICDREKEDLSDLKKVASQIQAHQWDVVVDTWSKNPLAVKDFLAMFSSSIDHYHYTSSIVAYGGKWDKAITEETTLRELPDKEIKYDTELPYIYRKCFSERYIMSSGVNYTLHRSHGMRGFRIPDPIDEPYWPVKFYRGDRLFVPLDENHDTQTTDVESYTDFIVHTSNNKIYGAFNVADPTITFEHYVKTLTEVFGQPKELYHIPKDFLAKHDILPYRDLPRWRPNPYGFYHIDVTKAIQNGLKIRSLEKLFKDQVDGYRHRNPKDDFVFGHHGTISQQKTEEIIALWKKTL